MLTYRSPDTELVKIFIDLVIVWTLTLNDITSFNFSRSNMELVCTIKETIHNLLRQKKKKVPNTFSNKCLSVDI
jgi:hypothetical protein